jgi:hypothetical protein
MALAQACPSIAVCPAIYPVNNVIMVTGGQREKIACAASEIGNPQCARSVQSSVCFKTKAENPAALKSSSHQRLASQARIIRAQLPDLSRSGAPLAILYYYDYERNYERNSVILFSSMKGDEPSD